MRTLTIVFLALIVACADDTETIYEVVPNSGRFPFPTELPVIEAQDNFDWQRYIESSKSKADRAFRVRVAYAGGYFTAEGQDSNASERRRANLAAEEFKAKCLDLTERYRTKLESKPEILKTLNRLIERCEESIQLQVELIAGSWGGSGVGTSAAKARMSAYINYFQTLQDIGASLHLQDLPPSTLKSEIDERRPRIRPLKDPKG